MSGDHLLLEEERGREQGTETQTGRYIQREEEKEKETDIDREGDGVIKSIQVYTHRIHLEVVL